MRVLAALLALAVAAGVCGAQDYREEEVLQNLQTASDAEELVDCILGTRAPGLPCRAMFLDFRRILPDIFENNCRTCTPEQKEVLQKTAVFLQRHHRRDFNRLARGLRNPGGRGG
ncbi:uncharacterized protein LOC122260133 [Penaeus japonicus]|uniref:uncharacterized protein LOC122260133 n=1 Tax=Penaeus japonicus TaxID=27405 RepID=UPI001C70C702|nr:uncharacterized protein LOC122260133 [Penaeus japonicus]